MKLNSERESDYAKLLDVIEKIRMLGDGCAISFPQIAVIGDQSAGKSALMTELTNVQGFPAKSGLGTKCPVVVRTKSATNSVFRVNGRAFPEDQLEDAVLASFPAEISHVPIQVEAQGPKLPELTLIDLPGIIHHNEEGTPDKQVVLDLIREYVADPRTLILAVTKADNDDANSLALSLAKEYDPLGERTLRIFSMFDNIGSADRQERAVSLINESVSQKMGPHAVICRPNGLVYNSSSEVQTLLGLGVHPDRAGVATATQRCVSLLSELVFSNVEDLRTQLKAKKAEAELVLVEVGAKPQEVSYYVKMVEQNLTENLDVFADEASGAIDKFYEQLGDKGPHALVSGMDSEDPEIPGWIAQEFRPTLFESPFFQGQEAFDQCLDIIVDKWQALADGLREDCLSLLKEVPLSLHQLPVAKPAVEFIKVKWHKEYQILDAKSAEGFLAELDKERRHKTINQAFRPVLDPPFDFTDLINDYVEAFSRDDIRHPADPRRALGVSGYGMAMTKNLEAVVKQHRSKIPQVDLQNEQVKTLTRAVRANWETSHRSLGDALLGVVRDVLVGESREVIRELSRSPDLRELLVEPESALEKRRQAKQVIEAMNKSLQKLNKWKTENVVSG